VLVLFTEGIESMNDTAFWMTPTTTLTTASSRTATTSMRSTVSPSAEIATAARRYSTHGDVIDSSSSSSSSSRTEESANDAASIHAGRFRFFQQLGSGDIYVNLNIC